MAKTEPIKPRGVQLNILLTAEEAEGLQAETERRQAESPGIRVSRAGVARDVLLRFLRKQSKKVAA
jgi:hypothetical protein